MEILVQLPVPVLCFFVHIAKLFPKGWPRQSGEHSVGSFLLLTGFVFLPKSLIKRMAQSVVEVMEDAKGKVQENLLANGGRSLKRAYDGPFPTYSSPFVVPAVDTQEGWNDMTPRRLQTDTLGRGCPRRLEHSGTAVWKIPISLIILLSHL